MHRNRVPCNSFLMVNMDRGRGLPTTTSPNMAAVQLAVHGLISSLAALRFWGSLRTQTYFQWQPEIRLRSQATLRWFTACIFDIEHPCCGQLTPVKTRHSLTSVMWPYRGLKFRAHQALVFFEVGRWPITGFRLNRGLMRARIKSWSKYEFFFFSNVFHCFWVMGSRCSPTLFEIKTEGQSIYTEILNWKLKNSIQILAYRGIA